MQDTNIKLSCLTVESIQSMADIANIPDISIEVATTLGKDVTFKVRQIIARAIKFMKHSNRRYLTCVDINKALKWSDDQPILGYQCDPNRPLDFSYSSEAGVFKYDHTIIDLNQRCQEKIELDRSLTDKLLSEAIPDILLKDYGTIDTRLVQDFSIDSNKAL